MSHISSPPASLLGYRCHPPPSPHGLPGHLPVEPSRSVTIPGVGCQYPRAPLKPSEGILMGMFGGGDPLSLRDMSSLPMDGVSPGQRQEGSVCLEPEPHHTGIHNGVPMVGKVVCLVSAGRNGSGTCLQLLAWPLFPWDDGLCPPAPPLLCPLSILLLPHKVAGAGCQANRIQQRRLILVEGGCRRGEEHQQRW